MVQTKKFENTFVNEYMAWNLHDRDVEKRAKAEGQYVARTETAKKLFKLGLSLENISEVTTLPVEVLKNLK